MLPAVNLDDEVWAIFLEGARDPGKAEKYLTKPVVAVDNTLEIARINELESDLVKQRETIRKWFRQRKISELEADADLDQIQDQLEGILKRKAEIAPAMSSVQQFSIQDFSTLFKEYLAHADFTADEKRLALRSILAKVIAVRTDISTRSKYCQPVFKIEWQLK
jgi:hypothetical protein